VMPELIEDILMLHGRKIIVADSEIDLSEKDMNDIFILFVEESRGSAGGRAAGSGFRKISRIMRFTCRNGECVKSFETEDLELIDLFDIPYSAVAMDIKLSDGQQIVVQGIVDHSLVMSYASHVASTK
jgi:hypothetical protein